MKLTLPQGFEVSDAEAKLLLEQILAQMVETNTDINDLTMTKSGVDSLRIENLTANEWLESLHKQMKIMNMHLSILNNEEIDEGDV